MSNLQLTAGESLSFILDVLSKSIGQHPGVGTIEGFESITGVTGSTDVSGISTDVDHRGVGALSVEFDKSGVTQAFAYIDKTLDSMDIESFGINGNIVWFIYLSDLTNIANVRLYLGTSSSHCVYWETADSSLSVGWNILVYNVKYPTAIVGNGIDLSNIDFIRVYVGFDAVGNTLNDIRVDSVMVLSSESVNIRNHAKTGAYASNLVVKNNAGTFFGLTGYNSLGSAQFIQIHDAASLPANGAVPVIIFKVNTESNFALELSEYGIAFNTGIVVCNSSTGATKTLGLADCWFNVAYI